MEIEKALCFVLPALLIGVVGGMLILSCIGKFKGGKNHDEVYDGADIVRGVPSNNTFPELTQVFSNLDTNLKRYRLKLNTSLKGYVTNE